jgi:hypothetical protein
MGQSRPVEIERVEAQEIARRDAREPTSQERSGEIAFRGIDPLLDGLQHALDQLCRPRLDRGDHRRSLRARPRSALLKHSRVDEALKHRRLVGRPVVSGNPLRYGTKVKERPGTAERAGGAWG